MDSIQRNTLNFPLFFASSQKMGGGGEMYEKVTCAILYASQPTLALVIYSSYLLIMKKRGVTKGCTELGLFLYLICPASYVLSEIANLKYGIKSESCNSSRN